MKPSDPSSSDDAPMEFPMPDAPLRRHTSPPPTYVEWMAETADRTRAWFARPIESRPPRRMPSPVQFVMED